MAEEDMAPPHKRRRVEHTEYSKDMSSREIFYSEDQGQDQPFAQIVENIANPAQFKLVVEGSNKRVAIHEVDPIPHKRQLDTDLEADVDVSASINALDVLTVAASADIALNASTTGSVTSSSQSSSGSGSTSATPSSSTLTSASPASSSESATPKQTSTTSSTTSTSSETLSSNTPSSINVDTTGSSSSATAISSSSVPSSSVPSSSISSSTISNSTSDLISSSSISSASLASNATISAFKITSGGSTYTLTPSSAARTAASVSSLSVDNVYLATISGSVLSINQYDQSYVTTFNNGLVSTIAQASTTAPTTTPATNSYTTDVGGAVGAGTAPAYTGASSPSPTQTTVPSDSGKDNPTPPAGTIAGGVIGGCAGLAAILVVAMMVLRIYRRKSQLGHQDLTSSSMGRNLEDVPRGGPGMAERAGLMPLVGAVPGIFRSQDRYSGASQERGFERVSGRKLPSAFSAGMQSGPSSLPMSESDFNASNTEFYRDNEGPFAGSPQDDLLTSSGSPPEAMTLSRGPQRTPTVHGPYNLTPEPSVASSPRIRGASSATFDRSDTPSSYDANRNSRFTEEV